SDGDPRCGMLVAGGDVILAGPQQPDTAVRDIDLHGMPWLQPRDFYVDAALMQHDLGGPVVKPTKIEFRPACDGDRLVTELQDGAACRTRPRVVPSDQRFVNPRIGPGPAAKTA